jgi:hypothetical protein
MEEIWDQRWTTGGYPRYNVTGEDNPPAPWPLASHLVARANAEAGNDERVWRVIRWLDSLHPLKSGSWFERCGQSITPPMPPVGIVCWTWYEVLALLIWHVAGVRPEVDHCLIRPKLLKGLDQVTLRVPLRGAQLRLNVRRGAGPAAARVNGKEHPVADGALIVPFAPQGSMEIEMTVP